MKKITKGLLVLGVAVILMWIGKENVFAENETVEYNVDMFENEGCLYSLDNEDNFTENHKWILDAGSEHNLYVKYPNGKVVKMPFVVPQAEPEISANTNITSGMVEYNFDMFEGEEGTYLYSLDNQDNFTENHVWQLEIGTGHTVYVKYPDGNIVNGGTFVATSQNSKPVTNSEKNAEVTTMAATENTIETDTEEITEESVEEVEEEPVQEESKNSGALVIIVVVIVVVLVGVAVFMKKRK